MNREDIVESAIRFTQESPLNYIRREDALSPGCSGMRLFDPPIFAFGPANDDLYTEFLSPGIIGGHFLPPAKWLPGARTVISFFLPYTERIRLANAENYQWPAVEWLHGRYEGQVFVAELSEHINRILADSNHASVAPSLDPGFMMGNESGRNTSNWSERHIAYACGLGTFSLSKGLITDKGTCGRFGSVVTDLCLPTDQRLYSEAEEYCTKCGVCAANCPSNAISEEGKNDALCAEFLKKTIEKHTPRYGCGKCQVGVPCESGRP